MIDLRCFWCTLVVPFGRTKKPVLGAYPKANRKRARNCYRLRGVNFARKSGLIRKGDLKDLGTIQQKGGKTVHAWAFEVDPKTVVAQVSNSFELEWPPRSGKMQTFPEIDRAEFFGLEEAETRINQAQRDFSRAIVREYPIDPGPSGSGWTAVETNDRKE